jgi:hypothetical protein
MKIEVWESEIEDSTTAVFYDDPNKENIGMGAILVRTIEGSDWNDCMKQHFELMGWNTYIPF